MNYRKIGMIGGGRVATILLSGWKRKNVMPESIVVTEPDSNTAAKLKERFPEIQIAGGIQDLKGSDLLFISVHPPVMTQVLSELKAITHSNMIICSLAPKVTIAKISEALGGHNKIIRMNPNAPSIVNSGYNPLAFSSGISQEEKKKFLSLMCTLGDCPETNEINIETYAVISAMGPTYLQFQLYQMIELAESFGLSSSEALNAVVHMTIGATKTIAESGLPPETVMNLVPVKPMAEDEGAVKGFYQNRLQAIYQKLRS